MDSVQHRKLITPPTLADVVSALFQEKDDLRGFEFIVLKHWAADEPGKCEWVERIYLPDLDSFISKVFDLELQGWELVGFRGEPYSPCPDVQSICAGSIYIEFSRGALSINEVDENTQGVLTSQVQI